MLLIDHERFFIDLLHHGTKICLFQGDGGLSAVSAGQEEQLLYQMIHLLRFVPYGSDGLVQDLLILLAPAVQHVSVSLNDSDGRSELVGCVVDKTGLLTVGIPHPDQKIVDGSFYAGQIRILEGEGLCFARTDVFDSILQKLVLVFREGEPAQLVSLKSYLIDRAEDPAYPPVFAKIPQKQAEHLECQECQYDGSRGDEEDRDILVQKGRPAFVMDPVPDPVCIPVDSQTAADIRKRVQRREAAVFHPDQEREEGQRKSEDI